MGEQEPNGWELLRALNSIDQRLDGFATNFVSLQVHTLLVERVKEVEADLADERKERVAGDAAAQKRLDDQQKVKGQTWTAIGLLAVGGVVTLLFAIFRQGLGLP